MDLTEQSGHMMKASSWFGQGEGEGEEVWGVTLDALVEYEWMGPLYGWLVFQAVVNWLYSTKATQVFNPQNIIDIKYITHKIDRHKDTVCISNLWNFCYDRSVKLLTYDIFVEVIFVFKHIIQFPL